MLDKSEHTLSYFEKIRELKRAASDLAIVSFELGTSLDLSWQQKGG